MLKPTPPDPTPPDPTVIGPTPPDPARSDPAASGADVSDLVPRYRRCGRCARCHGGGSEVPPTGDCWADYLDAVTAVLTRAAGG
ncbi:hypothetical protein [Kitasatospora sp. NPDC085879]|uniref:hypothetical protein n=1 Tax=Kitasatospora sp. NPDC085879 TaxID=3154769 RepID=UPI0034286A41